MGISTGTVIDQGGAQTIDAVVDQILEFGKVVPASRTTGVVTPSTENQTVPFPMTSSGEA